MNKGFSKLDNPNHKGKTNTWLTPIDLIKCIGDFDLDPCGYPGHNTAKELICLPNDGLKEKWHGNVWLNPPYGIHTKDWLYKLFHHKKGVALVFARTETKWFQMYAEVFDWVFFIKGRIKFINPLYIKSTNAGHGSCLFGIGQDKTPELEGVLLVNENK